MLIWLLTSKSCDPSNSMTLACSSMYLDEIMFRLLRLQIGKLKSLRESFFKLKDIKVRLFVEEEVWIVTVSCTIIVSYTYWKDLELYLSCIKSCMLITVFTGTGMPCTTTSWGGHGLSHGAWNWLGRDHCCGRSELASQSSEKSGNYMAQTTLQLLLVFEEREESWRCSSLSCILLSVEMCIWWILLWVWAAKWISMVTTLWRRLFVFDKLNFLLFSSM